MYKKSLGEAGLFSLKNTRLRGDIIAVYSNLMGGYREQGARLFLKVHRDRARDNKHKLEHGKFHYKHKLFHHKGDEAVKQVPRGLQSPSLEIQNLTGQSCEQSDLNQPCFTRVLD